MTSDRISLSRTGLPSVWFTGRRVAQSPEVIPASCAIAGRWTYIAVYRTDSEKTVVYLHYGTDHLGESDYHLAQVVTDVAGFLESFDPGSYARAASPAARASLRSQYLASVADVLIQLR